MPEEYRIKLTDEVLRLYDASELDLNDEPRRVAAIKDHWSVGFGEDDEEAVIDLAASLRKLADEVETAFEQHGKDGT